MTTRTNVEHASGKGSGDENFPVGSFLIAAPLRRHVHAFYRFARNADDIADARDLSSGEKLRRLDAMAAVIEGGDPALSPTAAKMRESLAETGVSAAHCHELLDAFRQDSVKNRYANWDELMGYCRLSAAPVGRYLLDLHGESRDTWPASDALCAALQVNNHLQDCGKDYLALDRVYLPTDWMAEEGTSVEELNRRSASPAMKRVLLRTVEATWPLVEEARRLPGGILDRGLRAEAAVIVGLADRLLTRLGHQDPLARRVKLGPAQIAMAVAGSMMRTALGW